MSVTPALLELGRWAQQVRPDAVPDDARHAARAVFAHISRRLAESPSDETTPSAARDAVHYGRFDGDAHVLGGRVGVGVALLRAELGAHSVGEVLHAASVGMEVGARVGLATLWSDRAATSSALPGAAAGAAALAVLTKADVGAAVARAVVLAQGSSDAAQAALGALSGTGTPEVSLSAAVDNAQALAPPGAWLSGLVTLPPVCAPVPLAVAVEAVREILFRHVRAAEKRLRGEQIERIDLRVPFAVWSAEQARPTLGDLIGRLVAFHELGPKARASTVVESSGATLDKAEEIALVAGKVSVVHDWALSVGQVRAALPYTGPLSFGRYRALRAVLKARGGWPGWQGADLMPLLRARPDLLASAPVPGPLAWPVQVRLYTTRGGWWPERRAVAETDLTLPPGFDAPLDAPATALL